MKIEVKNLGVLRQAEFSLGDFTIICGGNNMGKTYATYALFGFLWCWSRDLLEVEISDLTISALLKDGVTRIDVTHYAEKAEEILKGGCREYTRQLPKFFASAADRFIDTTFQVSIGSGNDSGSSGPNF